MCPGLGGTAHLVAAVLWLGHNVSLVPPHPAAPRCIRLLFTSGSSALLASEPPRTGEGEDPSTSGARLPPQHWPLLQPQRPSAILP
ncbi:hypothetical protein NDU88_004138 [Pleurodeles waltl]|uniref:Secreted protein n=1 Tax=Pleurodeles waltl TaxID=8319 RepID=A0AAV7WU81_PLEWA|nr:hypothetical protein NDU88_004138 [Pleurodeles waltl]